MRQILFATAILTVMASTASADSEAAWIARQHWVRIEADNGAVYAVDLGNVFIIPSGGAIYTNICIVDHDRCQVWNERRIWFDCDGHYSDVTNAGLGNRWEIAAPLSVIGRAANLACERAKRFIKAGGRTKIETAHGVTTRSRVASANPVRATLIRATV